MHDTTAYWDNLSEDWDRINGTALKPNAPELRSYQKYIDAVSTRGYVVLGATPELLNSSVPVQVVDASPKMIHKCQQLVNRTDVKYINSEWDQIELSTDSADLILSDGGLNVISTGYYHDVFAEAARILVKGGKLVVRYYDPCVIAQFNPVPQFRWAIDNLDDYGNIVVELMYEADNTYTQYRNQTIEYSFPQLDYISILAEEYDIPLIGIEYDETYNFPILVFEACTE